MAGMAKTNVVLYAPDGNKTTYNDVLSANIDDKGILWFEPQPSAAGKRTIRTNMPFEIIDVD
jgi:hypothetical protein